MSPSTSDTCGISLISMGITKLENNMVLDTHKYLLDIVKLYQCSLLSKIKKYIFQTNLPR